MKYPLVCGVQFGADRFAYLVRRFKRLIMCIIYAHAPLVYQAFRRFDTRTSHECTQKCRRCAFAGCQSSCRCASAIQTHTNTQAEALTMTQFARTAAPHHKAVVERAAAHTLAHIILYIMCCLWLVCLTIPTRVHYVHEAHAYAATAPPQQARQTEHISL